MDSGAVTDTALSDPEPAPATGLAPDESGQIMVLMYHEVANSPTEWGRTPRVFRKDLKRLYQRGYRPISLLDLVNGKITTRAGHTPVVLTFDDGTQGQFNALGRPGRHRVDPNSAVGILEAFCAKHPDFPLEATFFLSGDTPFGQEELVSYKLNYLVSAGMDIGNHTLYHQDLSLPRYQNPVSIQKAIGGQRNFLMSRLTEHPDYGVDTLALCFGQKPALPRLRALLQKGEYQGRPYRNIAILNVSGGPAFSPFDTRFKPTSIPRIRARRGLADEVKGLYDWLIHFDKNPQLRFVSDGDENAVTVPARSAQKVDRQKIGGRELRILD